MTWLYVANIKNLERLLNILNIKGKNVGLEELDKNGQLEELMLKLAGFNSSFNENEVELYVNALKKCGAKNVKVELSNTQQFPPRYNIKYDGHIDLKKFVRYITN